MEYILPVKELWDCGVNQILFPILAGITTLVITTQIYLHFSSSEKHVAIRDNKRHNWKDSQVVGEATHCSICENLLTKGFYCDSCGVAADHRCLKQADRTLQCKQHSTQECPMKHHWVKGNLQSPIHPCSVCDEQVFEVGIVDFQCCWCHVVVHNSCFPRMSQICELGEFRKMIIPPYCVEVKKTRSSISRRLFLSKVSSPGWPDWSPVIVVANCKSGSKEGELISSCFRHLLNPAQVVDLSKWPPQAALEWCQLLSTSLPRPVTVLVAGGDGTVGWVLNAVHKLKLKIEPVIGIVPLGTGNDLSRVLGWGSEHSIHIPAEKVLKNLQKAKPVKLDRWQVDVTPFNLLPYQRHKQLSMYNYVSVGVDAQVTLDFHRTRDSPFYLFSSRIFNKLLYLTFGTQQVVERRCQDLQDKLELYLDGVRQDLPEIESVVVLNIPSWGAGVDLWTLLKEEIADLPEQSISDGKLEVVAVYSSFHIAQMQVGLSSPHYIGQASSVKIKLKSKMAMQVDGEPWYQQPAEIIITHVNQASVLRLDHSHND